MIGEITLRQIVDLVMLNLLSSSKFMYNFSTKLALMSLIQWDSDTEEVNINMRLNFIYNSLSDLLIVYKERRSVERVESGPLDRTIAIKFTYLFNL